MVAVVRHWWWLPLLGFLIGAGSALLARSGQQTSFEAQSTLVIGPARALIDTREIVNSLTALDRRSVVATFALIPSSRAVGRLAQSRLGMSDAQISKFAINTKVIPDSNVLAVSVRGPDRVQTARLADEIALQTIGVSRDLYSIFSVKVLDRAQLPNTSQGSGDSRAVVLGGLLGLLIGLAGSYFLDRLKQRAGPTAGRPHQTETAAAPL